MSVAGVEKVDIYIKSCQLVNVAAWWLGGRVKMGDLEIKKK